MIDRQTDRRDPVKYRRFFSQETLSIFQKWIVVQGYFGSIGKDVDHLKKVQTVDQLDLGFQSSPDRL